jgi:hypothetical protein
LNKLHIPITVVDGADGLPIITKDGQQYKVHGINPNGTLRAEKGTWTSK